MSGNETYRTAASLEADDRDAIAELFAQLRARVSSFTSLAIIVLTLASLAVLWLSRGRLLCVFLPFIPFVALRRGQFTHGGLIL
ncbi:MAG: hypothetical protein H5U40_18050, partial [Polyangiaceae bacterium]|nr:hypothetical protein [Polyangiaceae bacterium]